VFAFAAVIVPLAQKRQYAISLNLINAEAGQQAQAADKVRSQLEAMQSEYNYILAKKYGYPSTVHVIDEVTRVLPDDTWLTQLEVKTSARGKDAQRDVYLRGESGNAGKLIALLEDSKLVEQAAPRSPTTKIQGAPGEIFDLGARLRTVALPAQEVVTVASAQPLAPVTTQPPAVAPAVPREPAPPREPAAPSASTPVPANAAPAAAVPPPQAAASAPAPDYGAAQQPLSPTTAAGFGPFPGGMTVAPNVVPSRSRPAPVAAPQAASQPTPRVVPGPTTAGSLPVAPTATPATPGEPSTEVPPAPAMPGAAPESPAVAPQPVQPQPPQAQPAPQQPDED
jgi:hypothetical protein